MKKLKKTSELLWLLGIVFVALGVAICSKANLGVSMIAAPAFILHEALVAVFPKISVGMIEYLIQGVLLLLLCLSVQRFHWKYLLAFSVAILYGYTLNFFIFLFGDLTLTSLVARRLERERNRLEVAERSVEALSPKRIMQLGFAVVRSGGKLLKSAGGAQSGDSIEIELNDGVIKARIE